MRLPRAIQSILSRKAPMGEEAAIEGARYKSSFYNWPAVTDDLLTSKGGAASIYRKMRFDPEIKMATTILIGGLLSRGWKVHSSVAEGEDGFEAAAAQASFVQYAFDEMPGSLDDVIEECMADALWYGTAIAEKVWRIIDEPAYAGLVSYQAIKPKAPWLFYFDIDDYGNPKRLMLMDSGIPVECGIEKFSVLRLNAEHGKPEGVSELRAAYKFWWMKDKMLQFWAIFLEKYGAPTAKGSYRRGLPKAAQDELKNVLDKIQQETAIVLPDDVTVELLEAARSGETSGFERLIGYCDKQMVKCLLGQTLTTDEGRRTGSFALGEVHEKVQEIVIKRMQRKAEEWVDETLIRPLIDYNFAEHYYPNFSLPLDQKNIRELSESIFRLVTCEAVDPRESWIREYLGLPNREELPEVPEAMPQVPTALRKEGVSQNGSSSPAP